MPPNPILTYKHLLLSQLHHKPTASRPETALLTAIAGNLFLRRDPKLMLLKERHPLAEAACGVPNLLIIRLEAVYNTNSLTISLEKGQPAHAEIIAESITSMNGRQGFRVGHDIGPLSTHTIQYGKSDYPIIYSEAGSPRAQIRISFCAKNYERDDEPIQERRYLNIYEKEIFENFRQKRTSVTALHLFAKGCANGIYQILEDFSISPLTSPQETHSPFA